MDKIGLLKELFDSKTIKVISMFISNPQKQYYLKEISETVKVPMASTHRILRKLIKVEIVDETSISKFKVYQLSNNDKVLYLNSFIRPTVKVIEMFVTKVKNLDGVNRIILHGKESETRANLLIIGENFNTTYMKELVGNLKEEHNYHISYMALTEEQYEQMSTMGLYSGTKKILYEK